MTTLMRDPIDHWLNLPVYRPRQPLRDEMWQAINTACELDAGMPRAYWTGVAQGYAVAFGLSTRAALDNARRTPHARTINPLEAARFDDEEHALACGLLFGYSQGISEHPDVTNCPHCNTSNLPDLDWTAQCEHGTFCEDCIADWHQPVHGWGADICTYVDELIHP